MDLDTSELLTYAKDLGHIPARAVGPVEAVLKKGATNLKDGMRQAFESSASFRQVGRSVSYDRRGVAREITFEIGPTIGGAGSLAGIAVEGGARGGGGTVNIDQLLGPEAAATEKFIGQVLEDLL